MWPWSHKELWFRWSWYINFSSLSIEPKLLGAYQEKPKLCWFSSEQWPCWSMNNCERYNNAGRKSWGVNPAGKWLLNTSLDYPELDLAAKRVYKTFQWFWGRHQILHFICLEGGCECIKNRSVESSPSHVTLTGKTFYLVLPRREENLESLVLLTFSLSSRITTTDLPT